MNKRTVIILAAGRGERMAANQNKILLPLLGQPILHYVLELWLPLADAAIVVINPADRQEIECLTAPYSDWLSLAAGGTTRAASVLAGLQALPPAFGGSELVAIHDAARPLTLPADIERVWQSAEKTGAAVLAAPVTDTIRFCAPNNCLGEIIPRTGLAAMQTPQVFRRTLLEQAYQAATPEDLALATDDAALVQASGQPISCVWASGANLKVTNPADLMLAEVILKQRRSGLCV